MDIFYSDVFELLFASKILIDHRGDSDSLPSLVLVNIILVQPFPLNHEQTTKKYCAEL